MTGHDLAGYDWLIDYSDDAMEDGTLHAPTAEQIAHFDTDAWDGDDFEGDVLCGRQGWWAIPGFISRLSVERCERCCYLLGYPHGTGSPKNDVGIRDQNGWGQ